MGDIVVGTGAREASGRLIYWGKIAEITNIDQYWLSPLYKNKKVIMNGSRMQQYGDNIYHTVNDTIVQEDSFHSKANGVEDKPNKDRDVGSTHSILICEEFLYLGKEAVKIPDALANFVKKGPGHKSRFLENEKVMMRDWLMSDNRRGLIGTPMHWR